MIKHSKSKPYLVPCLVVGMIGLCAVMLPLLLMDPGQQSSGTHHHDGYGNHSDPGQVRHVEPSQFAELPTISQLPDGLLHVTHIPERKAQFIAIVLPLILIANEELSQLRAKVQQIAITLQNDLALNPNEQAFLDQTLQDYAMKEVNGTEAAGVEALLLRIDEVPVAIALAQAAAESGWGTSRFLREGNALFGQWTTSDYAGIDAKGSSDIRPVRLRRFPDLLESVRSYMHNLNTHAAYEGFRRQRAQLRNFEFHSDFAMLLPELVPYSEKGTSYVNMLRQVIIENDLQYYQQFRKQPELSDLEVGGW